MLTGYSVFLRQNLRWLCGGLLLTLCSSFGQTFYISLFSGQIREKFDLSHGDFGTLYMTATLASAATLIFLGKVLDSNRVVHVAVAVFAGLAICCFSMSLTNSIAGLVAVLFGLRLFGQGMMTHTAMTAMGKWYVGERGRAVSTTSMGYHFGEGLLPGVIALALVAFAWETLWQVSSVFLLLVLPLAFFLLRVDREPTASEKKTLSATRHWTRAEVLSDPAFWALSLGILAPAFIGTSHFFHLVHITEYKGWSREWAAGSFVLLSIMTITWTMISGWLVDKLSARHLLPFFLIPLGLGCVFMSFFTAGSSLLVFMALLGTSYGISSALFGALWPEIYGTKHLAGIRAVAVAMMVLSSALGPGVTGKFLDAGVSYDVQLRFMGAYALLCACVMTLVSRHLLNRTGQNPHLSS